MPLRLSPRGLRTPLLRAGDTSFEVDVDLVDHWVRVSTTTASRQIGIVAEPLNEFYNGFTTALDELGVSLETLPRPVEVPDPATRFDQDGGHSTYDPAAATTFFQLLTSVDRIFELFGSRFAGKASRPGLFWGGMDYAASRYSGSPAPPHPGGAPNVADWVMREAYTHEVAAYGYFADAAPEGSFYAYTYPTPDRYRDQPMPSGVIWSDELGEWLLPYHLVRTSDDPEATLLAFLESAYEAAATTAAWSPDLRRSNLIER